MASKSDKIYDEALNGKSKGLLTAREVSSFISNPFSIYCNHFVDESEKDEMNDFQQLLFKSGNEHEDKYCEETYPGLKSIESKDELDGFKKGLEALEKGVDTLRGMPLFWLKEDLQGRTDVIVKSTEHKSVFGDFHYVIKEVKLAKNIKTAHIIQGAFYNYILGKIQGYTPPYFILVNRDGEEQGYDYDKLKETLMECIRGTRAILNKELEVTPTFGGCAWPWESYANKKAEEIKDISLVNKVGPSMKIKLVEAGYETYEDLAKADVKDLVEIKGVGDKTAKNFILSSKALVSGKHIVIDLDKIDLPERTTEIFLDLEGTGVQGDEDELLEIDYLIGIIEREGGKQKYIPFVAHSTDSEGVMWKEFCDYLAKKKDFIIYHWHHYEMTHLKKLAERHGMDEKLYQKVFSNIIDLYKVAVAACAYPTYGNSIKKIAVYMGFKWRHKEVNAMESIAYYLEYAEDNKKYKDKMQLIIDYNEDDCIATYVIKDWLEEIKNR